MSGHKEIIMKRYGLVKDSKIIKTRWVDETDTVLIPKLVAHGYLPVEKQEPSFDSVTQIKGEVTQDIQQDKIVESYAVINKKLVDVVDGKKQVIKSEALSQIEQYMPIQEQILIIQAGTQQEVDALNIVLANIKAKRDAALVSIDTAKSTETITDLTVGW